MESHNAQQAEWQRIAAERDALLAQEYAELDALGLEMFNKKRLELTLTEATMVNEEHYRRAAEGKVHDSLATTVTLAQLAAEVADLKTRLKIHVEKLEKSE